MAIYTLKSNILVYFSHLNYLLILSYVDDDGRYGEYFDPLGRAPTRVFERYMNEHCCEWIYSKQLQNIASRFCGLCLLLHSSKQRYRYASSALFYS